MSFCCPTHICLLLKDWLCVVSSHRLSQLAVEEGCLESISALPVQNVHVGREADCLACVIPARRLSRELVELLYLSSEVVSFGGLGRDKGLTERQCGLLFATEA